MLGFLYGFNASFKCCKRQSLLKLNANIPWCTRTSDSSFYNDIERTSCCRQEHLQSNFNECAPHPTNNEFSTHWFHDQFWPSMTMFVFVKFVPKHM
jgi:hypothetical protein